EEFKKIDVYIPPIELQNQFADFVKQVDKLKFEMQNSL
ncbi:restriction endonuclease S subunit, partial [Clostridium saccharobutylicum]|nr:restriction endonuclease S subunit [Clostridium saccharobutylicum]